MSCTSSFSWRFAVHEALDQVGAIIGPLVFSLIFFLGDGYREGFILLWIPALLSVAVLAIARKKVPSPQKLEAPGEASKQGDGGKLPRVFWLYTLFTLFSIAGSANFQLISYHLKIQSIVLDTQIPLVYAISMGVDAVAALLAGKTYDRIGLVSLLAVPLLTLPIPFLAFSYDYELVLTGMVLWGVVMGIQETIMRAAIADLTPVKRRGFAYGIFNAVYGASWFVGSALIGLLYALSVNYLILFVVVMELISIPLLFVVKRAT